MGRKWSILLSFYRNYAFSIEVEEVFADFWRILCLGKRKLLPNQSCGSRTTAALKTVQDIFGPDLRSFFREMLFVWSSWRRKLENLQTNCSPDCRTSLPPCTSLVSNTNQPAQQQTHTQTKMRMKILSCIYPSSTQKVLTRWSEQGRFSGEAKALTRLFIVFVTLESSGCSWLW